MNNMLIMSLMSMMRKVIKGKLPGLGGHTNLA